jgi:hypothetical protein
MKKETLKEGLLPDGRPDGKYYAFDWDDNILYMPTEIIVKSFGGTEIGMSTDAFSEYRHIIGKENFDYLGHTIVDYANDPFRNFSFRGDEQFIKDSLVANVGPSWPDFVECINGGSVFAIITARGHTPEIIKKAVKLMLLANKCGENDCLSYTLCMENLKKYPNAPKGLDDVEMIDFYLDMCEFHPVSYNQGKEGSGRAASPEILKSEVLKQFVYTVKMRSAQLGLNSNVTNDIENNFVPKIGFSDDDEANVKKIKKDLEDEGMDDVSVYFTKNKKEKL